MPVGQAPKRVTKRVYAPSLLQVAVVIEIHSRSALVRLREWSPAVVEALVAAGVRELAGRM